MTATRRTIIPAVLAALALCAPGAALAGDEPRPLRFTDADPSRLNNYVLYTRNFWKGAVVAPPVERRSPVVAELLEFADVPDATVQTMRLVHVWDDGNDHGGVITFDFTPTEINPDDLAPRRGEWLYQVRDRALDRAAHSAALNRVRFLRERRGARFLSEDQGDHYRESPGTAQYAGGYVGVWGSVVAGVPGCLMIEADSRPALALGERYFADARQEPEEVAARREAEAKKREAAMREQQERDEPEKRREAERAANRARFAILDEPDDYGLIEFKDWLPTLEDLSPPDWWIREAQTQLLRLPGGRVAYFSYVDLDRSWDDEHRREVARRVTVFRRMNLRDFWHGADFGGHTYFVARKVGDPDRDGRYYFITKAVIGWRAGCLMFEGQTAEEARAGPADLEKMIWHERWRPTYCAGATGVGIVLLGLVGMFCLLWWEYRVKRRRKGAHRPTPSAGV